MRRWEITEFQLGYLLEELAALACIESMIKLGYLKPYLNKSEAFRLYGRRNVINWMSQALITPIKDGQHSAVYRMNRLDLEVISRSIQLLRILNSI